jgi:dihydroorotate dehydrogenase (NAD+) catalytic subunit
LAAIVDLTIHLCGLNLRNPILPAAGPPGRSGRALLACAKGGAGALVSKTVSLHAADVPTPNMAEVAGGMLNCELWSELPPEQWIEREYALARESGLPLFVSLGYTAEDIRALAPRVRPFADAVELSTHYIGEDPRPMQEAIAAAREVLSVPIIVKLSPLGRQMVPAARAAVEAGAQAIAAINSFGPCLSIDIETGRAHLGGSGCGWLSGPAIRPLAVRCVYEIAHAVPVPVVGVGGIASGRDAVEMLMAGASAVQVCTAAILRGPGVFAKIATELASWLSEHGYRAPSDIVGRATVPVPGERALHAAVDPDLCSGCRLCERSCVYAAIRMDGKVAVVDPAACTARSALSVSSGSDREARRSVGPAVRRGRGLCWCRGQDLCPLLPGPRVARRRPARHRNHHHPHASARTRRGLAPHCSRERAGPM